jgi:hypothetical protein
MSARIYQPAKTAMSSGSAKTRHWMLEYSAEKPRRKDPLTGWNSIDETQTQVRLKFDTLEEAQAYAAAKGIAARVDQPREKKRVKKAYADNFKHDRVGPWSH